MFSNQAIAVLVEKDSVEHAIFTHNTKGIKVRDSLLEDESIWGNPKNHCNFSRMKNGKEQIVKRISKFLTNKSTRCIDWCWDRKHKIIYNSRGTTLELCNCDPKHPKIFFAFREKGDYKIIDFKRLPIPVEMLLGILHRDAFEHYKTIVKVRQEN